MNSARRINKAHRRSIKKLINLGWLSHDIKNLDHRGKVDAIAYAIAEYQRHWGQPVTGDLTKETTSHLERVRFCDRGDRDWLTSKPLIAPMPKWQKTIRSARKAALCRWQSPNVSFFVANAPNGYTRSQAIEIAQNSFDTWSSASKVQAGLAPSMNTANIVITFGKVDGVNGVLAYSELPCSAGTDGIVSQVYDKAESWVLTINPSVDDVSLQLVMTHELGHALGIDHGPVGNIMAPFYDPTVTSLGKWDKNQIRSRYS